MSTITTIKSISEKQSKIKRLEEELDKLQQEVIRDTEILAKELHTQLGTETLQSLFFFYSESK